jgi:hypothetical protein
MKPSDSAVPGPARRLSVTSYRTANLQDLVRLYKLPRPCPRRRPRPRPRIFRASMTRTRTTTRLIWLPHPPSLARWFRTPASDFCFRQTEVRPKPRFGFSQFPLVLFIRPYPTKSAHTNSHAMKKSSLSLPYALVVPCSVVPCSVVP